MTDANALKHMLAELNLEFLYEDHEDRETNLRRFKEFYQFMTPVSASPVEGAHRIELSTRLLCAIALKEEALHYASWEDSRYSKGERTMKVKVKSCC
jgi:hypothetical protein